MAQHENLNLVGVITRATSVKNCNPSRTILYPSDTITADIILEPGRPAPWVPKTTSALVTRDVTDQAARAEYRRSRIRMDALPAASTGAPRGDGVGDCGQRPAKGRLRLDRRQVLRSDMQIR
jgi:hypothetical protein